MGQLKRLKDGKQMNKKQLINPLFNKYLNELTNTAYSADCHYHIWWIYKKDRPKYVVIMNKYLGFFGPSISAHFVAMLMALCNLYDTRKDTVNFKNLVKIIKENHLLDGSIVANIEDLLKKKEALIKKIRILRSNHFAHINENLDYDKTLKMVNIKYDNFKELIELSYSILNNINYVSRISRSEEDTYRLLDILLKKQKKFLEN